MTVVHYWFQKSCKIAKQMENGEIETMNKKKIYDFFYNFSLYTYCRCSISLNSPICDGQTWNIVFVCIYL